MTHETRLEIRGLTRTDILELQTILPPQDIETGAALASSREAHHELGTATIVLSLTAVAIPALVAFFGRRKSRTSVRIIHRKRGPGKTSEDMEFTWEESASDSVN